MIFDFLFRRRQAPPRKRLPLQISIEKEGRSLTLDEFEKLTGAPFIPDLEFSHPRINQRAQKWAVNLYKKGEMTREQLWFGRYFKKEITTHFIPNTTIRWIDSTFGWGVFANRDFKKMEYIAEYTGNVRRRLRIDSKNAYCFEFILSSGCKTPYLIDAQSQGGLARYINHSETPNLLTALATFDNMSHVVLYTKEAIPKGAQLCYHYGNDYWSKRKPPLKIQTGLK